MFEGLAYIPEENNQHMSGMKFQAREGDILETRSNIFFDVKGLVHPPSKTVAFIRYIIDPKGNRKRGDKTYRKVYPLQERYELLRKQFPKYLVFDPVFDDQLCEVPTESVKSHYRPVEGLKRLRRKESPDKVEIDALEFAEFLKRETSVTSSKVGISGSILVGLHASDSDVDPIVYGSENGRRIFTALRSLIQSEDVSIKSYTAQELKRLFDFRSKDTVTPFEAFLRTESRKVLQGTFKERDYFIRCVRDWSEIYEHYGEVRYKSLGYARIRAVVTDDSEMIYTPCRYEVSDVKILEGAHTELIEEIASFRGRFCEQARNGETVLAQGKVEKLQAGEMIRCRLLLGGRTSDFMIPLKAQP